MGEKRGMQALEAWCRQVTAGYNGVNVTNMTSSWKDGLAFCALVHHFRPDLIDFASLSAENVYQNNQLAFSVAENVLGIPALLDAEDMVNYIPDRLSIMTYLSQFYQVLAAPKSKGGSSMAVGLKRPAERTTPAAAGCDAPDSSSATAGATTPVKDASLEMRGQPYKAEIFARQLQNDGGLSRQQARRVSDLCVSCKNPVFLAERLMVNGRLHHRVCFRCARCQSQLSLANYYETEQEQYCCETCPDEVAARTNPTEHSTAIRPTQESSSPSAIVAASEPNLIAQNASNLVPQEEEKDKQQLERPTTQHRRFLDSMVGGEATVEVTCTPNDSQPVLISEHDDDSGKTDSKTVLPECVENPTDVPETGNDQEGISQNEVSPEASYNKVVDQVPQDVEEAQGEAEGNHLSIISDPGLVLDKIVESANVPEVGEPVGKTDEAAVAAPNSLHEDKDEEIANATIDLSPVAHAPIVLAVDEKPADSFEQNNEIPSPFASPVIQVTEEQGETPEVEIVVPKPRRRKSKRSSTPQSKILDRSIDEYPEELNPFDDETHVEPSPAEDIVRTDQSSSFNSSVATDTPKKILSAPKISLNPFGSDDEDEDETNSSDPGKSGGKIRPGRPPPPIIKSPTQSIVTTPSPSPKKRLAPAPPPPKPQRTPSSVSSGEISTISRRKSAPPPPNLDQSKSPLPAPRTVTTPVPSPKPRLLSVTSPPLPPFPSPSEKAHKDLSNLHLQCGVNKDSHGQWKRKKGPAPPRPSPQKRQLRKLPLKGIQQELDDIEVKQVELERQGVGLEQNIRSLTEPEDGSETVGDGIHIEEMILQLFDLVNEKNELLRRQTELMYLRRQQRLEEEHAELEYQIRCLMEKPNGEKTDEDRLREEELIDRLVQVVHRRAEIVDCLEMDRRRQVEEDESIQQHLDVFNSRGASTAAVDIQISPPKTKSKSLKMIQSPIKLIKKDKLHKKSKKNKVDADKEVDESETAKTSPLQSDAAGASISSPPLRKEKDKNKTKSWFAK